MLSNYLKITLRNIEKYKLFSIVNIAGLTIGMSCSLLLMMYVANELSYETFHKKRDRIVRAAVDFGRGENAMRLAGAMSALGPALKQTLPEVADAVRFRRGSDIVMEVNEKSFAEKLVFFTDASVFDIFTFRFIRGEPDKALIQPLTCVLTENTAKKYFGTDDPVGRTLMINGETPIQITGILEDCPANTHLRFNILISYSSLEAMGRTSEFPWNTFGRDLTYLLLRDSGDIDGIKQKIAAVLLENTNESFAQRIDFNIQPLKDIYMKSDALGDVGPKGNVAYVTIFSSVAFLVLLIACFNFINLSTARSIQRVKEVGIRKVLGANRTQLVRQFLGESVILATLAIGLGMILFEILYPVLSTFLQNPIDPGQQDYRVLAIFIPLLIAVVGLFAGAYPAFFLSRAKPAESMKKILPGSRRTVFRKTGVLAQFTLAIILIIGTTVIYNQIRFMRNSDLGFDKENVVLVDYPSKEDLVRPKYDILRDTFLKVPGVVNVSGTYKAPGVQNTEKKMISRKGAPPDESFMIQSVAVDFEYLQAMGLRIAGGRNFSREFPADPNGSVLLNKTASVQYGISLGESLLLPMRGGQRELEVVGIIEDFHVSSFKERIEPMVFYIQPDFFYLMAVRIHPENASLTLAALGEAWQGLFPDIPFESTYLEETYDNLYYSEKKVFQLLGLFSCLAIFVACLGLFGLVTYTSERRNKEIGIRKVLGATVSGVTFMLMKNFGKWILVSNLIAWPAAYLIMNRWLKDYAYRIDLKLWMFLLAAVLIVSVTVITAGVQALRAALTNPVHSLRYE